MRSYPIPKRRIYMIDMEWKVLRMEEAQETWVIFSANFSEAVVEEENKDLRK